MSFSTRIAKAKRQEAARKAAVRLKRLSTREAVALLQADIRK
jgi:hypothetical protein